MPSIQIDGKEYDTDSFSNDAKAQLTNLQVCDLEIQRLQTQLTIVQTARMTYARALGEVLPK